LRLVDTARCSIRVTNSAKPSPLPRGACSSVGASSSIHRPMKSPGDSGALSSTSALMPPHWAWPSTTICLTRSTCTANSSAADTPWAAPSGA
jgi:hypothetical protein